jgi:hypothetical protein
MKKRRVKEVVPEEVTNIAWVSQLQIVLKKEVVECAKTFHHAPTKVENQCDRKQSHQPQV